MRLLALDPGMTTGWAFFEETELKEYGDTDWGKTRPNGPLLPREWWTANRPDTVVIEFVVPVGIGKHSQALATINTMLKTMYPNAEWVRSGQWKPVTGSWPLDMLNGAKVSTHVKDAIRIGLFKLRQHYDIRPSHSFRPEAQLAEDALPHVETVETT